MVGNGCMSRENGLGCVSCDAGLSQVFNVISSHFTLFISAHTLSFTSRNWWWCKQQTVSRVVGLRIHLISWIHSILMLAFIQSSFIFHWIVFSIIHWVKLHEWVPTSLPITARSQMKGLVWWADSPQVLQVYCRKPRWMTLFWLDHQRTSSQLMVKLVLVLRVPSVKTKW